MNTYKLYQGTTLENLKSFIYLTNEYGKPSQKYIDSFMENFGSEILNTEFNFNAASLKSLDQFWSYVKQDCEKNNIAYHSTCDDSIFYYVVGTEAVKDLEAEYKDDWKSLNKDDKLDFLKDYIKHFDEHLTLAHRAAFNSLMAAATLVVQPAPQPQQPKTAKKLTKEAQAASVMNMLQELGLNSTEFIRRQSVPDYVKRYINANILANSSGRSILELINYTGSSIFFDWSCGTGELKEILCTDHNILTREQLEGLGVTLMLLAKADELKNLLKQYNKLDYNGNVIYNTDSNKIIPYAVISYDDLKKYESKQSVPPIKHYSLVDEYSDGSENSLIGVPLYIKKEKLGTIVSNTELKTITGEVIDLGEYIYKNNIADPTDLNTEYTFFIETYKEI